MKYLITVTAFLLMISQPAPIVRGQAVIIPKKFDNSGLKKTIQNNQDTIRDLIIKAQDIKPKIKYVYKTKYRTIRDTVIVYLPINDIEYITELCPPDTVYIDRPILVRKKNLFKRIF